jgi:D-alanyl-lipoteichoic acid acyltransferase DltB (MBOAT superfamily)
MRFNSLIYFLFLAVVVILLWLLPMRWRKSWLLAASCVFYGSWHYPYLLLLLAVGILNHFGAKWIIAASDRKRRGAIVLAANVLILAVYKYADWLIGSFNTALEFAGGGTALPLLNLVLPLGISFFVFEGMSFTMDVIRKREKPHAFADFQLFMAFFPKLIAGPIMRAKELLPQIENPVPRLAPEPVMEAGWLLGTGLMLKVLADGISSHLDRAYAMQPGALGSLDVLLMAVGFGIQIYYDFSSYSRMAIGSALLCGVRLVDNFNYPYSAASPVEFWNRWHMSLSRWIRDYLFFPIIGKQATLVRMCRAALITMTICGVWHGAGWNYALWGFYHGLLIAGYHLLTYRSRQPGAAPPTPAGGVRQLGNWGLTFLLVSLGWLWFRASTLGQSLALWQRLLLPWQHWRRALSGTFYLQTAVLVALTLLAPFANLAWQRMTGKASAGVDAYRGPAWLQGVLVGLMIVVALIYYQGQSAFIYFQF